MEMMVVVAVTVARIMVMRMMRMRCDGGSYDDGSMMVMMKVVMLL